MKQLLIQLTQSQINSKEQATAKPSYHQYKLKSNSGDVEMSDIDGKSFMKNVKLSISNKKYFLSWYNQLQVECDTYNIKIRPLDEINKLPINSVNISELNCYKDQAKVKMGKLLLNKFNNKDIINESFKEGRKILHNIKNGFEFINTFLWELHPTFANAPLITKKIPKYSNYNDLYDYCKGVRDYFFWLKLDGIIFNQTYISTSFLAHLDDNEYFNARIYAL